ncbi:hypothetical protein ABE488_15225 [Luteimonas sp. TWI662]|uniref:hypothetical protein n=1 Tax=Luteimonas sp. TWI662 TaxID=3136789 RepID=UPI00320934DF
MAASHILLLTLLAAPTVAGCASKPPLPRSVTEADVTTPQGPRLAQPGEEVAGSRVRFPASVVRGARMEGRAPPGSTIHDGHRVTTVGSDGRVILQAPDRKGDWMLRIDRPGQSRSLTVRVRLVDANN